MDLAFFLFLSAAAAVGFLKLYKWATRQDTEARGHERIRNWRQRGLISRAFEDIIEPLRKKSGD